MKFLTFVEKQPKFKIYSQLKIFQLICPVCRLKISFNEELTNLMQSKDDFKDEIVDFKRTYGYEKWKKKQLDLWSIYNKQKLNGGIINIQENKTKYLITTVS